MRRTMLFEAFVNNDKELNRILDKINMMGKESLTDHEKNTLDALSRGEDVPEKPAPHIAKLLNNKQAEAFKAEFKREHGYDMGDTFVFAMSRHGQEVYVTIVPEAYWRKEGNTGHMPMSTIQQGPLDMPDQFEEIEDGVFEFSCSVSLAIRILITCGIMYSASLQNYVQHDFKVNQIEMDQYVSEHYPTGFAE